MKYRPVSNFPFSGSLPDAPLAMPKQDLERSHVVRFYFVHRALFALGWR